MSALVPRQKALQHGVRAIIEGYALAFHISELNTRFLDHRFEVRTKDGQGRRSGIVSNRGLSGERGHIDKGAVGRDAEAQLLDPRGALRVPALWEDLNLLSALHIVRTNKSHVPPLAFTNGATVS